MKQLKKVYIAHPLRGDVQENIKKATSICKDIAEEGEVVPYSPLHSFGFMDPNGDQSLVMQYCFNLLSSANELWVFGNWRESEGCRMEIAYAQENNIPIRFMSQEKIA